MASSEGFPAKDRRVHRFGIYATIVFAAFLLGFLPMWLTARARAQERDAAQQTLRFAQIENHAAAAAILSWRGEYQPALEAASTFYTTLQAELGRADFDVAAPSRATLQKVLGDRDQVITLLARGDPAASDRLANVYSSYRQAVGTAPRQEPSGDPAR